VRAVIVVLRIGDCGRRRSCRRDQVAEVSRHRPVGHDRDRKDRRHRHGGGCRLGAPGDGDGRGGEDNESREGDRVFAGREDEEGSDQHIDRQRQRRDPFDLAELWLRAVQQSAHQKDRGEDEAGKRVENVRADRFDRRYVRAGQRPQRTEHDGGDGKPESNFELTRCFVENFRTSAMDKFRVGTWLVLAEHCFESRAKAPTLTDFLCADAGPADAYRKNRTRFSFGYGPRALGHS
jgi:hypothetical protein